MGINPGDVPDGDLMAQIEDGALGQWGFILSRSSVQSIPNNTTTRIQYTANSVDPKGFAKQLNTSSARAEFPAGSNGLWLIGVQAAYSNAGTNQREVTLRDHNGNQLNRYKFNSAANGGDDNPATVLYCGVFNAGAYVYSEAWQNRGSATDYAGFLWGFRIYSTL